jgi:hypothetical protein
MNSRNISIEYLRSDREQVIVWIYFFNFGSIINSIFNSYGDVNYVVSDAQRAVSNI